eukprot:TRINITY_DN33007_c0_g1_i1.p1 TRINITY_DN33007_c0_g1~~TRINITY_DN33007_c0_g1_i1.p1  ORF type:complete len:319 (+),score=65.90 TRINITY_DN33007_c0_g1_i1:96-1052(+)
MIASGAAHARSSSSGPPSPSVPVPAGISMVLGAGMPYHGFKFATSPASPQATSSTPRVPSPGRIAGHPTMMTLHRPISSPALRPLQPHTAAAACMSPGHAVSTTAAAPPPVAASGQAAAAAAAAASRGRVWASAATSASAYPAHPGHGRVISANMVGAGEASALQTERALRQKAEARVRELESLVSRLRSRVAILERGGTIVTATTRNGTPRRRVAKAAHQAAVQAAAELEEEVIADDAIDKAICEYLERNPDFPVSIQKVAPNAYIFGDRGTVNVTQVGEHIVVRVGGGFKSLQVFMDERALMVSAESNMRQSPRGN